MEAELPFWEMEPSDGLVTGAGTIPLGIGKGKTQPLGPQVFIKPGEVYAVYLPTAKPAGTLDLTALDRQGRRSAGSIHARASSSASRAKSPAAGRSRIGDAPADAEQDWVVLVKRAGEQPAAAEQGSATTHFPARTLGDSLARRALA